MAVLRERHVIRLIIEKIKNNGNLLIAAAKIGT